LIVHDGIFEAKDQGFGEQEEAAAESSFWYSSGNKRDLSASSCARCATVLLATTTHWHPIQGGRRCSSSDNGWNFADCIGESVQL
jgi:hypothetical protein